MNSEEQQLVLSKEFLCTLLRNHPHDYYTTPSLNGTLHLQCKGFKKIQNLEDFTALKVLYLNNNAIIQMENLECLTELHSLMLHENLIEKIENIFSLTKLSFLNLSDNLISQLPPQLAQLTQLETLLLKRNRLQSVEILSQLKSVHTLDLSDNKLEQEDTVIEQQLKNMSNLQVLYLQNNPFTKQIKNYRKSVLSRLPTLKFLDDQPVSVEERRYVKAWQEGGLQAERTERGKVKEEQLQWHKDYIAKNPQALEKIRRQIRERLQAGAVVVQQQQLSRSSTSSTTVLDEEGRANLETYNSDALSEEPLTANHLDELD